MPKGEVGAHNNKGEVGGTTLWSAGGQGQWIQGVTAQGEARGGKTGRGSAGRGNVRLNGHLAHLSTV